MRKIRLSRTCWLPAATVLAGCAPVESGQPVWVTIPHGASFEEVAESLATHQLVSSAGSFRWYAKFSGVTDSFEGGSYQLQPGMSPAEIVEELQTAQPFVQPLRIPAGLWANEVAWYVQRQLDIPADSFKAAVRDSSQVARIGARGETLEGYLFPGEHQVRVGASAREVVHVMLDAFESNWHPEWSRRLDSLDMSRDEIVTLASIIQGEGGSERDAPYVASVYHNRLNKGMRLQADPTVVYALGRRRRLYNKDYSLSSPFNTYRFAGLPPSPISNPSAASLEAALYPEETGFFYFVASTKGRHLFSQTYREHLATIRSIRRKAGE